MEDKEFEEVAKDLRDFGINIEKETISIQIPNAKENFTRGMTKYCGGELTWVRGYDEIVDWLTDNKGKGLLLTGDVGLGKSVFCMKVLPILLSYYHRLILRTYEAGDINEKVSEILTKKLVCIDDIGIEGEKNDYGNKRVVFNDIVDKAERERNFLVLTTNLTNDELMDRYGKRTIDRLNELTRTIILFGDSNRK